MKRTIRLTEGKLRRMIRESVRQVVRESRYRGRRRMNEGGHLYGTYDDGTKFTNSKETWLGVPGTTYISHGEWNDGEIWYNGHSYNATDMIDGLWSRYASECDETGEEPTQNGFDEWLKDEDIEGYLMDCEYGHCYTE